MFFGAFFVQSVHGGKEPGRRRLSARIVLSVMVRGISADGEHPLKHFETDQFFEHGFFGDGKNGDFLFRAILQERFKFGNAVFGQEH